VIVIMIMMHYEFASLLSITSNVVSTYLVVIPTSEPLFRCWWAPFCCECTIRWG